jgi:hypothetical protein
MVYRLLSLTDLHALSLVNKDLRTFAEPLLSRKFSGNE